MCGQADEAVHIGPSPARESYLSARRLSPPPSRRARRRSIPGYGFLSENADFAQAVIDAGLIWVGPKPHSIRAMGLKDAAKKLMDAAGVPTTPGYLGEDQAPERLQAEADAIGYPVLIKAVAGGRRQGNAAGQRSGRVPGHAALLQARGRRLVRRRSRADREIHPLARATSKCRYSATRTATSSTCSSAIARSSAVTRR
jgi:acetyl/propionyl-CoA carboxylase alpha subunit